MTVNRDTDGGTDMRLQCDDCGDFLDKDFDDSQFVPMIAHAKSEGWTIRKTDHFYEHWCPDCKPTGLAAQKALFGR